MITRRPTFQMIVSPTGGTTTVCLEGMLGFEAAPALQEGLARVVNRGASNLVIDLGGVRDLHLAALSTLIGVVHRVSAGGGDVRMVNVPPTAVTSLERAKIPLDVNGLR